MVVIAIIGLLSSVVLASLNGARAKARDAQRQSDTRQIYNALVLYQSDNNGALPSSNDGGPSWSTLTPLLSKYLPKIPDDPQGSVYGNPTWRFYYYAVPGTTFGSWGWGSTNCDNKYVVVAYGTEGTVQRNDCGFNGNILSIIIQ